MNILILGSGGREHALAWKMAASPLTDKLYCAPGNAGIARDAECVALDLGDHKAVIAFALDKKIDLVVVGPEAPLCAGVVDDLEAAGIKAFGPTKWAARLEGSKGFTKDLCKANNIPTAAYERFKGASPAKDYVRKKGAPIVVKADGLAAGKGVVVAESVQEAEAAIDMMFGGGLGAPAWEIVIEDCLVGEEASFFALCDGETAIALASAQDHKRVGDGDIGPNTGGMGAFSPSPLMTSAVEGIVMERIIFPAIAAMRRERRVFKGVLYAGLMLTEAGPMLLEFNARFGDPECQVLMMRLMSDPLPALIAAHDGVLKSVDLRWHAESALCVVMAANGYPGEPQSGTEIRGLDAAGSDPKVKIFHAGTRRDDRRLIADGGRVLGVTALGSDLHRARDRAYAAVDRIQWPEGFFRRDIGRR
jgi:phosphoribosylamine---glycine ligase